MTATDTQSTNVAQHEDPDDIYVLVLRLQLQDLEENAAKRKGKGKTLSDRELAEDMYAGELEAVWAEVADARLAESLEHAHAFDESILQQIAAEERQAQRDAEIARVYGETGWFPTGLTDSTDVWAEFVPATPAMEPIVAPGVSAATAKPEKSYTCVICLDKHPITQSYLAPCKKNHRYDLGCLNDLFQRATRDETLFPPRCCLCPITLPEVAGLLEPDVLQNFQAKEPEFSTAGNARLYCPRSRCSAFVGSLTSCTTVPSSSNSATAPSTRCPKCKNGICLICKGFAHPRGYVCKGDQDPGAKSALEEAERMGWKRCPECAAVVELSYGCNHITCRCKAEFCYLCRKKWRTCRCVLYTEEQLLRAGRAEVQRAYPGQEAANPEAAEARLQAAMRHVEEVHDCQHPDGFVFNRVGGACARCNDQLPMFLMDCERCHLRYCKRCVLNRL